MCVRVLHSLHRHTELSKRKLHESLLASPKVLLPVVVGNWQFTSNSKSNSFRRAINVTLNRILSRKTLSEAITSNLPLGADVCGFTYIGVFFFSVSPWWVLELETRSTNTQHFSNWKFKLIIMGVDIDHWEVDDFLFCSFSVIEIGSESNRC